VPDDRRCNGYSTIKNHLFISFVLVRIKLTMMMYEYILVGFGVVVIGIYVVLKIQQKKNQ